MYISWFLINQLQLLLIQIFGCDRWMRFNFTSTPYFSSLNLNRFIYFVICSKINEQSLYDFGYVSIVLFKINSTKMTFQLFFFLIPEFSCFPTLSPLKQFPLLCLNIFSRFFLCLWLKFSSFIFSEDTLLSSSLVQSTAQL